MRMRNKKIKISLLVFLAFLSVILFQNCSEVMFQSSNGPTTKLNNGELYDGKLKYVLAEPGKNIECGQNTIYKNQIHVYEKRSYLLNYTSLPTHECHLDQSEISYGEIQWGPTRHSALYKDTLYIVIESLVSSSKLQFTDLSQPLQPASLRTLPEGESFLLTGDCNPEAGEVTITGDLIHDVSVPCQQQNSRGHFAHTLSFEDLHPDQKLRVQSPEPYPGYEVTEVIPKKTAYKKAYWSALIEARQPGEGSTFTRLFPLPIKSAVKPIFIKTADQLQSLKTNDPHALYILDNDIDIVSDLGPDYNWQPIGNSSANEEFSGAFDGDFRKIKNLRIKSDQNELGLFGYVNNYGVIKNLVLEDSVLINPNPSRFNVNVGTLVGYLRAFSVVENVKVVNSHISGHEQQIGGLVGRSWDAVVRNSETSGSIKNGATVGGVIGYSLGSETLINIQSNMNLGDSNSTVVGGVVGFLMGGAHIERLMFTGQITGTKQLGGLLGVTLSNLEPIRLGQIKVDQFYSFGQVHSSLNINTGVIFGTDDAFGHNLQLPHAYYIEDQCTGCDHYNAQSLTPKDFLTQQNLDFIYIGFQKLNP